MKKILFLTVILLFTVSCTTNYYTVLLTEDTNLYKNSNDGTLITSIPKDTKVYISAQSNKKLYKKIKWNNYFGWAYSPNYTSYSPYVPVKNYNRSNTSNPSANSYNYRPNTSTGGTVNVKGYTRKDGTYVRPHTRSAPRRK